MKQEFPILEFDPSEQAVIEPSRVYEPMDVPEHCVFCYFSGVVETVREQHRGKLLRTFPSVMGDHPVYEIEHEGRRLAVLQPGMGAPLAAGFLEQLLAVGCKKFIVCGVAGVLDKEIALGKFLVPSAAVRDEGTSYHYLPPGREVEASPEAVAAIVSVLQRHQCPYDVIKTWTTDGFFRETTAKVALRKAEGCTAVEMEAAAYFAVAQYRQAVLGLVMFAGDDVSGNDWDRRPSDARQSIAERICWLSAEACLTL